MGVSESEREERIKEKRGRVGLEERRIQSKKLKEWNVIKDWTIREDKGLGKTFISI